MITLQISLHHLQTSHYVSYSNNILISWCLTNLFLCIYFIDLFFIQYTRCPPSSSGRLQIHLVYCLFFCVTCAKSHWWPHLPTSIPRVSALDLFHQCFTEDPNRVTKQVLLESWWHSQLTLLYLRGDKELQPGCTAQDSLIILPRPWTQRNTPTP